MKKIFASLFISLALISSAFGAINPNQIQGYQTVFTGKSVNVNGGSEVSQINGTTLITPTTGSYPIDNVMLTTTVAGVFQSVQVNSTNVGTYTEGYLGSLGATNALRWSVLATNGAPAAAAEFAAYYPIEGLNFSRFQYGTANAKAGSLQFKVRCSVSGTYSGAIKNYANTRSYPFSYSCTSGTNTQVYVQNIPGDTGGTWIGNTNAGAAYVTFDLGSGANFKTTANAWVTGDYNGVTGTTNLSAQTNGATLTITDVQFEVGSFSTQFERKLYSQVLAECRYYLPYQYYAATDSIIASNFSYSTTLNKIYLKWDYPTRVPITGVVVTGNLDLYQGASIIGNGAPSFGIASTSGVELSEAVTAATVGLSGIMRPSGGNPFIIYGTGSRI